MKQIRASRAACLPLSACLLLLSACAVNPATGKRQLVLIGESQEIRIGKENDPQIVAQFGLYEDEALQTYVAQLGHQLAAQSERSDLEWTFRVLDDPLVNAFALPGGFIYITRGILAYFNSEAELASVLGHEIGHVTARHGVSQMSKAQLAQFGLALGSIVAPEEAQQFGNLAESGLGLLFLKYSRDDERQADDLGLRYLVRTGYDPHPMADVFVTLKRVSASAEGRSAPNWLSTHPDPENREGRVTGAIVAMNRDFSNSPVRREALLEQIEGIVFGENPRYGYFKDSLFLHPEMKFRIEFPEGWKLRNTRQAVVGTSEERDAQIQLALAKQETAEEALRAFLDQGPVTRTGGWSPALAGMLASGSDFNASLQQGSLSGRVVFVEYDGRVFGILGYAAQSHWSSYEPEVSLTLSSFRRLTDERLLSVQPKRLRVVRLDTSMSLKQFAERYGATVPPETLAVINGLDPDARLQSGRSYKVIQGGELPASE